GESGGVGGWAWGVGGGTVRGGRGLGRAFTARALGRSTRRAAHAAWSSASCGGIPPWSSRRPPCTPASRHATLAGYPGAGRAVPCPASGGRGDGVEQHHDRGERGRGFTERNHHAHPPRCCLLGSVVGQ